MTLRAAAPIRSRHLLRGLTNPGAIAGRHQILAKGGDTDASEPLQARQGNREARSRALPPQPASPAAALDTLPAKASPAHLTIK